MSSDPWYTRVADAALGLFDPQRAAIRRHWRRVENESDYRAAYEVALRVRGYKSAQSNKNMTPWLNATSRSADGEITLDRKTLQYRSRAVNRDDALGAGLGGTFTRGVIGTGLRPQACTGDDEKDDALEEVWEDRKDSLSLGEGGLSHGQHQALCYAKRNEDGEVFLRPAVDGEDLWFEVIEADRVATPPGATPRDPGGRIVDGVEKDRFGRAVAYWVLKQHPGDTLGAQTAMGATAPRPTAAFSLANFDRVEKSSCYHDRSKVSRPGQTRGVPLCHSILQDLRDLDLLILATLKRTQVAACLAVFLTSEAQASDLIELTAEDYGYQLDQKLEPGMIFRLFPGEKAEILTPPAGLSELDRFVFLLARRIGAAVGLSPQAVLKNWDNVNYSGARTIKIDDRLTFHVERASFSGLLTWEWKTVLEFELMRGNEKLLAAGITPDDLEDVKWVGDEEQWVDPQAEAAATQTMLALGLTTYQTECARLGHDWQQNLRDKVAAEKFERDLRAEAGLPEALPSQTPDLKHVVPPPEPKAKDMPMKDMPPKEAPRALPPQVVNVQPRFEFQAARAPEPQPLTVNVSAPSVNVAPPTVNVEASKPIVIPAPVVNVEAARAVVVPPAAVTVNVPEPPAQKKTLEIERDAAGKILRAVMAES